jgi:peptidoglycan lytic transglycosylase
MIAFPQSNPTSATALRPRVRGTAAVLAAIAALGGVLVAPVAAGASEGSSGAVSDEPQIRAEERDTDAEERDGAGDDSETQADAEQGDDPSEGDASMGEPSRTEAESTDPRQSASTSADDEPAQIDGDSPSGDDATAGSGDEKDDGATPESRNERQPREGSRPGADGDSLRDAIQRRVNERTEGIAGRARERSEDARERAREAVEDGLSGRSDDATSSDSNRRPRDPSRDRTTIAIAGDPGEVRLLPGRRDVLVRRRALVRGYIPIGRPGRVVVLEVMRRDGSWGEVDRTRTIEGGKFYLAWYPTRPGYFRVRARPVNPAAGSPSRARLLYIYRTAIASWYGPGFYGNRTACGQTFTNRLLGVAHRSLPCGYRLTVRYGDRAITVRVVDRGPFVPGRDYDLTEATRNYLGFDGVDEIWATA